MIAEADIYANVHATTPKGANRWKVRKSSLPFSVRFQSLTCFVSEGEVMLARLTQLAELTSSGWSNQSESVSLSHDG